ncbi:AlpA family transcriptional regulator [Paraburkholderia sp. DHOC27]|uniref:helix-turn-helix transcriptional regulator n=1 Tax=Paraburkholderia sp. DHOC27 TaxID=2303330 RepID=UPI000E3D8481|nr:AlpA family phage regulatory protein [Paraburkholderia sp. DHOC27]RFU46781.1 AlpA family phage regulatory protein [Paraburkholderia sp. DHOC27]
MADQTFHILIPRWRVSEITGLQRSALYERIARGEFPAPVTIGSAAVRWIEAEVVAWVQQQIDTSRAQPAATGGRRARA